MPIYDYICKDCKKSFETVLTLVEHGKERSRFLLHVLAGAVRARDPFFVVTGKKS